MKDKTCRHILILYIILRIHRQHVLCFYIYFLFQLKYTHFVQKQLYYQKRIINFNTLQHIYKHITNYSKMVK